LDVTGYLRFWNPDSGIIGGFIFGALVIALIVTLAHFIL
jgi:hypothetical protein